MLIKNWMSKPAITIDVDATLPEVKNILNQYRIHMLPVMEGDRLAGIITERDLSKTVEFGLNAENSLATVVDQLATKIRDVMIKDVVTVPYNHTIQEAAEMLLVNHISGIPVVGEQKEIIGVITKTDIFNCIILLSGGVKKGVELGFEMVDRPESLKEIIDTMRDYGARLSSILSTPQRAERGHRRVYIRIHNVDRPTRKRLTEVLKEKATFHYALDHIGNTRELSKKEGEL
jgi:acetoin utilization protein AcuB